MAASRLGITIFVILLVMQITPWAHYPFQPQGHLLIWSAPAAAASKTNSTIAPTTTTSTHSTTTTSTLYYKPPAMTKPYIIRNVNVTAPTAFPRPGDPQVIPPIGGGWFPSDLDVVIYLPTDQIITTPVIVKGGRNVRIVGGQWDLRYGDACLVIDSPSKSAFVEGCHLNSGTHGLYPDMIALRNRTPAQVPGAGPYDVYFQNILVDYCNYEGVRGANHTDLIQDQTNGNPLGNVYIENFTGVTSDQGFFFPNYGPTKSIHLRNVDLSYGAAPLAQGALIWLRADNTKPILPGSMEEVYVTPLPSHPAWRWYSISVWPKNYNIKDPQFVRYKFWLWGNIPSADGRACSFMPADQITGYIRLGPPPGGSFVSAQNVGLNYRSPHDRPAGQAIQTTYPSTKKTTRSQPPGPIIKVPLPKMRLP